jgi:glc operon protein GlcG
MRIQLALMSAAALALGITGAAAQADPKVIITGATAKEIGDANQINGATAKAIALACEKLAVEHMQDAAIVIIDTSGNVVHEQRMDGAARYTAVSTAELKAKTAMMTRRPTSLRQYALEQNPSNTAREFAMGYFPTAGGLPIWSKDSIIGFIGVGGMGGPNWSDEQCAHMALTQVVGPQPALPQRPAPRPAAAGGRGAQ